MNRNLPPYMVYVDKDYLFDDPSKEERYHYGHLISVRALQNQAPQFSVLLSTGALYTGLPANALFFTDKEKYKKRTLEEVLMWDNISSVIDVIAFDTLVYMPCTVKLTNDEIIKGIYMFTIDYVGLGDLSRSSEHWKQTHVIKGDDGRMYIYPQYRIKFLDRGICSDGLNVKGLPRYKHNDTIYTVGS